MPALDRRIGLRGARFYRGEEDELLFVHYIDSATREGPRAATKEDTLEHPKAWADFVADQQAQGDRVSASAESVFRPMVTFVDPEGGAPLKEVGPHASKRAAARAEGRHE
jgi:hypothetical protein